MNSIKLNVLLIFYFLINFLSLPYEHQERKAEMSNKNCGFVFFLFLVVSFAWCIWSTAKRCTHILDVCLPDYLTFLLWKDHLYSIVIIFMYTLSYTNICFLKINNFIPLFFSQLFLFIYCGKCILQFCFSIQSYNNIF